MFRNGVLKDSALEGEIRLAPIIIVHNGVDLGSRTNVTLLQERSPDVG